MLAGNFYGHNDNNDNNAKGSSGENDIMSMVELMVDGMSCDRSNFVVCMQLRKTRAK